MMSNIYSSGMNSAMPLASWYIALGDSINVSSLRDEFILRFTYDWFQRDQTFIENVNLITLDSKGVELNVIMTLESQNLIQIFLSSWDGIWLPIIYLRGTYSSMPLTSWSFEVLFLYGLNPSGIKFILRFNYNGCQRHQTFIEKSIIYHTTPKESNNFAYMMYLRSVLLIILINVRYLWHRSIVLCDFYKCSIPSGWLL